MALGSLGPLVVSVRAGRGVPQPSRPVPSGGDDYVTGPGWEVTGTDPVKALGRVAGADWRNGRIVLGGGPGSLQSGGEESRDPAGEGSRFCSPRGGARERSSRSAISRPNRPRDQHTPAGSGPPPPSAGRVWLVVRASRLGSSRRVLLCGPPAVPRPARQPVPDTNNRADAVVRPEVGDPGAVDGFTIKNATPQNL